MLDPKMCERGREQYELFKSSDKSRGKLVQYDYRRLNGELISCVSKTVEDCRKITLKRLEFKGASVEEIRQYIASTRSTPFDYLDEVPCGQPAAETAFKLGVQPIMINSSLVSAQTRKRCYWTNIPNIEQPADRGVLLKDIIESGESFLQKAYALTTRCSGAIPSDTLKRHRHTMIAEPVMYQRPRGKNEGGIKEGKAPTVTSHSYEHNNLVVEPIPLNTTADGKAKCLRAGYGTKDGIRNMVGNNYDRRTCVAIPADDVALKQKQIYKVESGQIDIKGKLYRIKLADGYYIIRKLLPIECERLQTLPEGYTEGVSDAQRIKALGNGWTVEVIAHILKHIKEVKS